MSSTDDGGTRKEKKKGAKADLGEVDSYGWLPQANPLANLRANPGFAVAEKSLA